MQIIDNQPEQEEKDKTLKLFTFAFTGIFTGYFLAIPYLEADIIETIFENYNYSFYLLIPTFGNVPFSIYLTKILIKHEIDLKHRIILCIIFKIIFFWFFPFFAVGVKSSKTSNF